MSTKLDPFTAGSDFWSVELYISPGVGNDTGHLLLVTTGQQ